MILLLEINESLWFGLPVGKFLLIKDLPNGRWRHSLFTIGRNRLPIFGLFSFKNFPSCWTLFTLNGTGTGTERPRPEQGETIDSDPSPAYSSFTLPDSDLDSGSDSDSKPDGYIVLCRNIHIGSDPDPCTESFPNCYCTHFRERYISIPGTDVCPYSIHFNQGIRVQIRTNVKFLHSTGIRVRVGIRVRIRQCE